MKHSMLYAAWRKLMLAYVASFLASLLAGGAVLALFDLDPEALFEISTKRLSYAVPVMDLGVQAGIDGSIILFCWNSFGALATLSFIYTAALFNPLHAGKPPLAVRRFFCSPTPMRLLRFLPGCLKIEAEALRRLYVWLMVPLLGMILLGIETGLSASTSKFLFGSYTTGLLALVPHGVIEIPAFALAGAVAFSGHLLIKPVAYDGDVGDTFRQLDDHRGALPIRKIALWVIFGLLAAGLVEAHVTPALLDAG